MSLESKLDTAQKISISKLAAPFQRPLRRWRPPVLRSLRREDKHGPVPFIALKAESVQEWRQESNWIPIVDAIDLLPGEEMRTLSKSKLLAFRQCARRLWLELHRPELREDSPNTQASFDLGNRVGDVARKLYDPKGNGVLIDAQAEGFPTAVARSKILLNSSQPIFEAGFSAAGALAFADVMLPVRKGGRLEWRMIEVKSSTKVKSYHRSDVAIQAFIAKAAGARISSISIANIDSTWVYDGDGSYDGLLKETDLTDEAFGRANEVKEWIAGAQSVAVRGREPKFTTGRHCNDPFACGFLGYCEGKEPQAKFPVGVLPRRGKALQAYIDEKKTIELRDVPDKLLNETQLRVKKHTLSGRPFFDSVGAATALSAHKLPALFLDFESIQFAVPIWKGTRPFQNIPFQFSVHRLSRTGAVDHRGFLDLSGSDPSNLLVKALIDACGTNEPVFAYNAAFEKGCIAGLAARFPRLQKPLLSISDRLVDLLPIAQRYYYHPSQEGSWSLKSVLPAAAPELTHAALDGVKDGGMAMKAFLEAIHEDTPPARKQQIEQELFEYCRLDTYAMVRIWQVFAGRSNFKL